MNRDQIEEIARAPWAYASADLSDALRASLAMPARAELPQRRMNATAQAHWSGHSFTVCIGFDDAGTTREVFADHAKGDMAAMLADACVLISIALQHGITPADLGKSLGTVPDWINGAKVDAPASPIGAIIAIIADVPVMLAVDWQPGAGDYIGGAGE